MAPRIPYVEASNVIPMRSPRPAPPPMPTKPPRPTVDEAACLIPPGIWNGLSPDRRNLARRAMALAIHADGTSGGGRITPWGVALAGLSAVGIVARVENGVVIVPSQPNIGKF